MSLPSTESVSEMRPRLGSILVRRGRLTPEQLEFALMEAAETGERLGEVLVRHEWLTEEDIARALAEQFELSYMDPGAGNPDPAAVALLPEELARRHCALPIRFVGSSSLLVAVPDPTDEKAIAEITQAVEREVQLSIAERSAIEWVLMHAYTEDRQAADAKKQTEPSQSDEQVMQASFENADLEVLVARLIASVEQIGKELHELRSQQERIASHFLGLAARPKDAEGTERVPLDEPPELVEETDSAEVQSSTNAKKIARKIAAELQASAGR